MKAWIILCFLMIVVSPVFSQNLTPAEIEAIILRAEKWSLTNKDSALHYADIALQEGKKLTNHLLIFNAYRTIGLIQEDNNCLQDAYNAYQNALQIAETWLPVNERFKIYTDWAIVHKKMGKYSIAYDYHWKTVEEAEKVQNWEMVENGYHGLGTMYSMMSDFEQSIQCYHKSIEAAEKWNNQEGIVLSNQNISNIYMKAQNYEMAKKNIVQTYEKALSLGDTLRIGAVLKIYGNIELALKNFDQALEKHLLAKDIFLQRDDNSRLAESLLAVGDIYMQQNKIEQADSSFKQCEKLQAYFSPYTFALFYSKLGKFYIHQNLTSKAISTFLKSLSKTDSLGFKEIARENHLALANIYSNEKLFDKAYQHIVQANQLSESLFQDAKQKTMTESQFKFDISKKDAQIEAQKKLLKQSGIFRFILICVLLTVSVLLYFTWRQMKAKQKATKHAELLMKELHHRVKNNFQTVTSIMRLQARNIKDPSVVSVLSESRSRLEAISMIHQQLYGTDNVQSINFKLFVNDLIERLRFAYNFDSKPFQSNIEIEGEYIDVDLALPLGLMINELLTNSFKYAYPSVETPQLSINLSQKKLYYADNGKGLPDNFSIEKTNSFGIQLITAMAQQLKGKYQFGNNNGMFFNLHLQ